MHFQVLGTGHSVEGGAFEWTDGCTHCVIRITIRDGTFLVNDANDFSRTLAPGVYLLSEFRGIFMFTQNQPHDFSVLVSGGGKVTKLD